MLEVSLRPIAKAFVALSVLIFSGAFFLQLIVGPYHEADDVDFTQRAINALMYCVPYAFGLVFIVLNFHIARPVMQENRYFIAFALLGMASIAWSYQPMTAVVESIQLTLTVLASVGIVASLDFRSFFRTVFFTSVFVLSVSIIYIYFIPSYGLMGGNEWSTLRGLPQGVFTHKNTFGEAASFGLLLAIAAHGLISKRLRLYLLGLSLFCLLASSSATKLAGCAAAIGAFFAWRVIARMHYGRAFSMLSIIIMGTVFGLVLPSLLEVALGILGRDVTLTGRTVIWEYVGELFVKRPILGYGLGSVWHTPLGQVPELPFFQVPHAHNVFVEVALRLGIVGLFVCLFALGRIFFQIVAFRNTDAPVFRILFLTFIYAFMDSIAEYHLFGGNQFIFLFLMSCSGYFALERLRAERRARARISQPRAPAFGRV